MGRYGPAPEGAKEEIVRMMMTAFALLLVPGILAAGEPAFTEGAIHVGVVVKDLEASTAFYTQVIGMKKTGAFDVDSAFGEASGLTGGLAFHVDVFKLRDEPDAAQFKMMSFEKDAKSPRSTHIQDALGMQYVTLNVDRPDTLRRAHQGRRCSLPGRDTGPALRHRPSLRPHPGTRTGRSSS